jgi:hypothetical protein
VIGQRQAGLYEFGVGGRVIGLDIDFRLRRLRRWSHFGLVNRCFTSGREQGNQQGNCSDAKVVCAGTSYYTAV